MKQRTLTHFLQENRSNIFCIFLWTIVCLIFSKPINTVVGNLGDLLFFTDNSHQKIYQGVAIAIFYGYFVFISFKYFSSKLNSSIRGSMLYASSFFLIWYILNKAGWMKPEIDFIQFSHFPKTDLISIVWVLFASELTIFIILKFFPRRRDNQSSFLTDVAYKPTAVTPKDLLNFSLLAVRIANEAKNIASSESVVFGINGEWGEGKTFMINLIKDKIEKEDEYIDFSPWKTNSGKATTQLFFDELKEGLKGKIMGINWKIDRYAEALMQLDKSGIGKMIGQLLLPSNSIETQKNQIKEAMESLEHNLIVFVDDLDRLAKNEIADVLKLMRDTANFPNLVFIAAYDRNYLNEAIRKEINDYEPKTYLDKIVLWEFQVPGVENKTKINIFLNLLEIQEPSLCEQINAHLNTKITSTKSETSDTGVTFYTDDETIELQSIHESLFTNLRVIKRFCNSLVFEYKAIEALSIDDYLFYVLKFFFPKIHKQLGYNFEEFLISKYKKDQYEQYLNTLNEKEGLLVTKIFDAILITKPNNIQNIKNHLNYLNHFFSKHEDVTQKEFIEILEYKNDDFKSAIKNKNVKTLNWEMIFASFDFFLNQTELPQGTINYTISKLVWLSGHINEETFYHTTLDFINEKKQKSNNNELNIFLDKEFREIDFPFNEQFLLITILQRTLNTKQAQDYFLTTNQCKEILELYLTVYLEKNKELKKVIAIFKSIYICKKLGLNLNPEINQKFRSFIEEHKNGICEFLITPTNPEEIDVTKMKYSFEESITSVFKDFEDFNNFISSIEENADNLKLNTIKKYTKNENFDMNFKPKDLNLDFIDEFSPFITF